MTDPTAILLQFWGKTPKQGQPPEQFHPAIYHMLDVAFVAETLLRDGAPRLRRALLHAWQGCDPDALIAWLPFLIATHDLGKISAAFQGQAKPTAKGDQARYQRERLLASNIPLGDTSGSPPHSLVSAHYLWQHLVQHEPGVSRTLRLALRDAMSGHHGVFGSPASAHVPGYIANEDSRWEMWRHDTYLLLRTALLPANVLSLSEIGVPHRLSTATVALTGFIILCDWLGSNNDFFAAHPELSIEDYLRHSRSQAAFAVTQAGFGSRATDTVFPGFQTLFPHIAPDKMRPLQHAVEELPSERLPWPVLFILEAPTGEGKTEAALALARKLAIQGCSDELYFGLPTMATGNQMFKRLEEFFEGIDTRLGEAGLGVKLIHGYAALLESDLRAEALANDIDITQRQAALEWFGSSKKNALLAPRGVGTVDQVELAGLNVRHYMLRLMAMAGKVVIIDEVHAYDEYMSTILEHTLRWLAELNTSVILLSATLPVARHHALAHSFLAGLPHAPTLQAMPASLPYPILATYAGDTIHAPLEPKPFRENQCFTVRFVHHEAPREQARHLLELVADGGAVARICNLVDDAQQIYQALLDMAPDDCPVLLHSRFPLYQREQIERNIAERLGKPAGEPAPRREIIIGTQVLEQSLDYDVDVMVSDLAPIDLLLQRAGRLHRHEQRNTHRPVRHREAVLYVQYELRTGTELPWLKPWAPIYDSYVMLRTWATLHERAGDKADLTIELPQGYRTLIEEVYHADEPKLPTGSLGDELHQLWLQLTENRKRMADEAKKRLTPRPQASGSIVANHVLLSLEDQDGALEGWQYAKTRLGERVTVVPVSRHHGALWLDPPWNTDLLDSDITPRDLKRQHEIIRRSLPISSLRLVRYFQEQQPKWPWGDTPSLLRYIYPLELNAAGEAQIAGVGVRLDPQLGLVITKEDPT